MSKLQWKKDGNGSIFAERHPLRATILQVEGQSFARYVLQAPCRIGVDQLLESGTAPNVEQAKQLAEAALARRQDIPVQQQKLIMIVLDNEIGRRLLAAALRKHDHTVIEVCSDEEVSLALARLPRPDLLIQKDPFGNEADDRAFLKFSCGINTAITIALDDPTHTPDDLIGRAVWELLNARDQRPRNLH
ncbi:MAG TPA: hypothetical protein VHB27_01780 [Rhodopila sp.]|uniref:hypothetical protein n=1 Tax=Rhodopila sp. TaxID=2480087 RepID=UPI002CE9A580|nr:hypothetical protein [Rhodopila sp.]HVY13928.1 hypothetical protein [Rhodopila sp.]